MATAAPNKGLQYVRFIYDDSAHIYTSATVVNPYVSSLSERNSNTTTSHPFPAGMWGGIVDRNANDVAMTVLPNAPIDAATGLPVPTIAVATDGGVSVIKDDGTVVDSASTADADSISFTDDNGLLFALHSAASNSSLYLAASDVFTSDGWSATTIGGNSGLNGFPLLGTTANDSLFSEGLSQMAQAGGLSRILWNSTENQSLLNYTTSTYNTGWMNGDIKGAFLSDTDDTDLTDAELVTNGDFATGDLTGFTYTEGKVTVNGSNQAVLTTNSTADAGLFLDSVTWEVGKIYVASVDLVSNVGSTTLVRIYNPTNGYVANVYLAPGTYSWTFECLNAATSFYVLQTNNVDGESVVDNFSVKLADADRSVNNNPLNINGTVTRSPVATGADLVAYSGFSASNYLEQPYNSDLDFGTGDFCIMGWGRTNINGTFLSRGDGVSAGSWYWRHSSGSTSPFYIHDGSAFRLALNVALPQGDFVHFALLRRSGVIYLYGNGALMGSLSGTYPALSMSNATAKLRIGDQQHSSYSGAGEKQALLRISATAPTAGQIAKIYEDEKVLFQENAQATLYDSSDAVTALAHDDATNLLHVGTSAGRSVFQGLRRVDNTTTAVGTAISASNSLVVEE